MIGQARRARLARSDGLVRRGAGPGARLAGDGYQSPTVQALWAPWVLHTGLTPESAYSGKMGKVIAFALEAAGAPVVKGGAGQAVDGLSRR